MRVAATRHRPAALVAAGWLAVAAALAGPAALAVVGTATPAAAAEPCVGVIVDARLLGGGVSTGCAQGDPSTGLKALTMAGYSYAFVPRQPGLVCQVDGAPECSRTSTQTYWSYWYRPKGSDSWVYASQGAGTHDPAPGSTEAWVWQDGGRRQPPDIALRTICPQAFRPVPASRSSSPSPDRTRTASRSPSPRQSASGDGAGAAGRTSEKPSAGTTTTPPPTSATPTATTTSAAPATSGVARSRAPAEGDSGGGAVPWAGVAVGGGLIAALGGAALARSRRGGP